MIKTCAVCKAETYDADPITVETEDTPPVRLRIWFCSPDCAWSGGAAMVQRFNTINATREGYRMVFDTGGLEEVVS